MERQYTFSQKMSVTREREREMEDSFLVKPDPRTVLRIDINILRLF